MGVSYLLDTHVFLWLLGEPHRIPDETLGALSRRENQLLVSAVSAMEVATKVRLGKLEAARVLLSSWASRVHDIGADHLALTTAHALLAGSMGWGHRDPFDRLLVAQAQTDNLTLVTTDQVMRAVPGLSLLSW